MEDLDRLAQTWETQLGKRRRLEAGWHAGVRPSPNLVRLVEQAPEIAQPEAFAVAREAVAAAAESRKPALGRLALGFAEWIAFAASAAAEARWRSELSAAEVRLDREVLLLSDAEVELATCTDTERRRGLAAAISEGHASAESTESEVVQRRLGALSSLGVLSDAAAAPGVDLAAWSAAAESMLRASEGALQEALDFRLRRERLPNSGRAELELALELPILREHGSATWVEGASAAVAEGLGIDPRRRGRVSVDSERRGSRQRGALVTAFAVPDEVVVLLTPQGTPADLDRYLSALGAAWHWSGIEAGLGISDRLAPDAASARASGALIGGLLELPEWQRRVLRLPSGPADELSRAFAFRHLLLLRLAAARFLTSFELRARGATAAVRESYRARMSDAAGGDWGTHGWLALDPLDAAAELRGAAQAVALANDLRDHFNEDWWRNPNAGEYLDSRWAEGGGFADTAPDLNVAWRSIAERAVG